MRRAILTIAAVVVSFPAGVLLAFLATPLLWKLEAWVPLELAGHSGPADWILIASGVAASAFAVFRVNRVLTKRGR